MSDFEQGLANIMGGFIQTELDCVEKQNQEIEQLKEVIEEVRETINKMIYDGYAENGTYYIYTNEKSEFGVRAKILLQILDKAKENK